MLGARVQVKIDPNLSWIWQCFHQEAQQGGIVKDQKYTDNVVLRERFEDHALSRRLPRDQEQRSEIENVKRVSPTTQEKPKFTPRIWLA